MECTTRRSTEGKIMGVVWNLSPVLADLPLSVEVASKEHQARTRDTRMGVNSHPAVEIAQ
ncbi:hypothetical protein BDV25DRAFT_156199 [Aspergillus avenaceus]|uniref:Uncharacterized protein n=1 Tax=Aspergillus avenaceus TaxID=36643 RepID=A0A5N6TT46_ASPAV|nr:hypothetical protein BDV25DRAFT_156199 [Aspergillus avenaceus]